MRDSEPGHPSALLVATRNSGKVREIREILVSHVGLRPIGLDDAGLSHVSGEDDLEVHETFGANARAKARHFAARSGMRTLADDSGLCVDALGGAPGVRSKRFSGTALRGSALDRANNAALLRALANVPEGERTARFVCAAVLLDPVAGIEHAAVGQCEGTIVRVPRGTAGFGYDPLFVPEGEETTVAELPVDRKNEISHRAWALRKLQPLLTES